MDISHTLINENNNIILQFTIDGVVYKGTTWNNNIPESMTKSHGINFEEEICNIITSMVVTEYVIRNIDRDNDTETIKNAIAQYITTHVLPTLTRI